HQARRGAKGLDRAKLADARARLTELGQERPAWSRLPLLEARIAEIEGNPEQAIAAYQRALELGDVQPRIIQRLVTLLAEHGNFAAADHALRRLEGEGALPKELSRLGAQIALANRDYARAVNLAE